MSTDLRKRKITYTIILTSDSPAAHHRRMYIKTGALAVVSFVVFVAVICYAVYTTITMGGYIERNAKQLEQLVHFRVGALGFPFGDRLAAHPQKHGQLLAEKYSDDPHGDDVVQGHANNNCKGHKLVSQWVQDPA